MAKMTNIGLDQFADQLQRVERGLRGEAERAMLRAGGEVLKEAWKNQITEKHHIKSGEMMKTVESTDIRRTEDGAYIEVYPQGTDSHRINNAQKAFILHHGRKPNSRGKGEIKGDKFVKAAEDASREKVTAAMQSALNEYLAGKE